LRAPIVRYRHRGIRPQDGMLASYPRSGTTWLRFMLTEALTEDEARFGPDNQPIIYVGGHAAAPDLLPGGGRLSFTHETWPVGDRRVVYVVRDPRSVAVSEHRWLRRRGLAPPTFDRFVDEFLRGRSNPWGRWDTHVYAWLESDAAKADHLLVVRFEKLRAAPEVEMTEVLQFLGAPGDPSVVARAVANNTLERMREKEEQAPTRAFAAGVRRDVRFVKEGATGWKDELSIAHAEAIERTFGDTMTRLGYLGRHD
jgi:Sulfotransferase domain